MTHRIIKALISVAYLAQQAILLTAAAPFLILGGIATVVLRGAIWLSLKTDPRRWLPNA